MSFLQSTDKISFRILLKRQWIKHFHSNLIWCWMYSNFQFSEIQFFEKENFLTGLFLNVSLCPNYFFVLFKNFIIYFSLFKWILFCFHHFSFVFNVWQISFEQRICVNFSAGKLGNILKVSKKILLWKFEKF